MLEFAVVLVAATLYGSPDWVAKMQKHGWPYWIQRAYVLPKYFLMWPCFFYYCASFLVPEYAAVIVASFMSYAFIEGMEQHEKDVFTPPPIKIYLTDKVTTIYAARPAFRVSRQVDDDQT